MISAGLKDFKPTTSPYIGWLSAASFGAAGSINFFNLAPVLQTIGNVGILLFIIGMIIALITGYGWFAIVSRYPDKVGGATVNSYESFKSRSPLLLTILCFANWLSWVAQAALSSIFCATALTQWFSVTLVSSTTLAAFLLFFFISIGLTKLTVAARIILPMAIVAVAMAVASGILPILFNGIEIPEENIWQVHVNFPGWFGYLTAIMSGFYVVGWIVPAYEVTTWLTGEMKQPQKTLPKAFITTAIISSLMFIILPIIWLGTLGHDSLTADYTQGTNWLVFSKLFPGIDAYFASWCGLILVVSWMILSGIGSLIGSSRMIVQLAEYGLFPSSYQKRMSNGAPIVAVCITGFSAMIIVLFGTPIWLIAATNFGYLSSMILASIGANLLAKDNPEKFSLTEKFLIRMGLVVSIVWIASILLGFQQYGMTPMMCGVLFILLGAIPYLYRKVKDVHQQGKKINFYSIHLILPMIFLGIMMLNSIGYFLMLYNFPNQNEILATVLNDIFITVILLTLTIGIWITDSVAHVATQVSNASYHLSHVMMTTLANSMKMLGEGLLNSVYEVPQKLKLKTHRKDELGVMINNFSDLENKITDAFNSMDLTRKQLYESRDKILKMNKELEERVIERTHQLQTAQQQLLVTARQAGMADVATSILHNIGNALNSVKVMLSLLQENNNQVNLNKLTKVVNLLKENMQNLTEFLTQHEKGKILPDYLIRLIDFITENDKKSEATLARMVESIRHIEDIVAMQKNISNVSGIKEKLFVSDVVEDAIKMCSDSLAKQNISLIKQFNEPFFAMIDKTKVVQILVNLIQNAKEAVVDSNQLEKIIIIKIEKTSDEKMLISVSDNGVGIISENLIKIFSLGFTTKQTGHGFGLHSSAIAAKEMGGSLIAESLGSEQGATFILSLPINEQSKRKSTHVEKSAR